MHKEYLTFNTGILCTTDISTPTIHPSSRDRVRVVALVSYKWYELGLLLGIPAYQLDRIEDNRSKVEPCLPEMLFYWLNATPDASWRHVIAALEKMGGHCRLTYQLIKKVQISTPGKCMLMYYYNIIVQ